MISVLENMASRIIVCGFDELENYLQSEEIVGIITACSTEEYSSNINSSGLTSTNPKVIIDRAKSQGILHYQSLLYETYGEFFDQTTPHEMSTDEEAAYLYEQAESTLGVVKIFLDTDEDKKIIIHCARGSDRSAMIAVAYFLALQESNPDIDLALRTLQKIRPNAGLDSIARAFRPYFGLKFPEYRQAIHDYRDTIKTKTHIPNSQNARDFLKASSEAEMSYPKYVRQCERFGISPP